MDWPQNGIVSFQAISGAETGQSHVPITIGQVFAKGAVGEGQSVKASVDGEGIPTQVDKKATWPDGSLRHAIITVDLDQLPAGASPFVTLRATDSSSPAGQSVTIRDLLGTNFEARATFHVGGTTYKANARDLLAKAAQRVRCKSWGQKCNLWMSGPLVSAWLVGGPLKDASGKKSPRLNVYFYVRAYVDPSTGRVSHARVDTVVENTRAYAGNPGNVTYDAKFSVGHKQYQVSDLEHYAHTRWHKVLWWQGKPDVYARLNGHYIQATNAVSRYADVQPTSDYLKSRPTSFPPMDKGNQTKYMSNTGAQPAIGPLPRWTSLYIVSTQPQAFAWMLANDDAVGSYPFHYRDGKTGRPLSVRDHPYVTVVNRSYAKRAASRGNRKYKRDLLPACKSNCSHPYHFNIAHHPSIGYVPYMVTGDYYYLEELQFAASYVELWANAKYRHYGKGRVRHAQGQVRGQAWTLRTLSDAAFITPDKDPLKDDFMSEVRHTLSDYIDHYVEHPTKHPLHVLDGFGAIVYPHNGNQRVGIATWQEYFFTWAVGHAAEQGFTGAKRFLRWLSWFPIHTMTGWKDDPDGGYCWLLASAYSLQVRDMRHSPEYGSLKRAYRESFPYLVGLNCNTQPYVNAWNAHSGKSREIGEMRGYAYSPTGYPSNLQIGLAMAAESGVEGGDEAWRIFDNRSVQPGSRPKYSYGNNPKYAVIPRE